MSNAQLASDLVRELSSNEGPRTTKSSLTLNGYSVQTVLMKEAILESVHDLDNLGDVEQHWFSEHGMLVIDLSGD